ncbi:MAG: hypothetical protein KGM92_12605 [Acidobacteriota bacterium]|nr:hypothetical protein [Acidobacteriota bacterium]
MGIRDNRGQESPTPFRHHAPCSAGLPFSVAHIAVARGRDDEKRPSAQGLQPAVNAVEAGITEVWNLLVSGQLKVMASLTNWFREFRKYHRDDKGSGKIVKRDDHLMDATRYLIVSGRLLMRPVPKPSPPPSPMRGCRDVGG